MFDVVDMGFEHFRVFWKNIRCHPFLGAAYADGPQKASLLRADGHRYAAQALFGLFVVDGVALFPYLCSCKRSTSGSVIECGVQASSGLLRYSSWSALHIVASMALPLAVQCIISVESL